MTAEHTDPAVSPDMPEFGPLAGLRVIDLTAALAGGSATMHLADLGAEVIKVESIQHYPTSTRGPRRPFGIFLNSYPDFDPGVDPWNRMSWFNSHGRNKRGVTMDLTRERGREIFLRLVEKCDGLLENNPPGLLSHLGIGPDELLERHPRLVIVRMPPLGTWGPDSDALGFGFHYEELAGFAELQGYEDGEQVGSLHMDSATGPVGASAFLLGLIRRHQTGRGTVVEVSQVENLVNQIGDLFLDAAMNDRVPRRWGNRHPVHWPQNVYRCAGDDQWLVLTITSAQEWAALRALLGDPPSLARPELETAEGRRQAADEIDRAIEAWTTGVSKEELFHMLQAAGIAAGPVMDEADAFSDPQLHAREWFHLLEHPAAGTHFHPGANFRLTDTPTVVWRAAPTLGQDNEYVYRAILGVTDDEYDELVAEQHIGWEYL